MHTEAASDNNGKKNTDNGNEIIVLSVILENMM